MSIDLHCWSCLHYRVGMRCARGRFFELPLAASEGVRCAEFEYEPGSDEAERDDRA